MPETTETTTETSTDTGNNAIQDAITLAQEKAAEIKARLRREAILGIVILLAFIFVAFYVASKGWKLGQA